jgi:hypothetical protein
LTLENHSEIDHKTLEHHGGYEDVGHDGKIRTYLKVQIATLDILHGIENF